MVSFLGCAVRDWLVNLSNTDGFPGVSEFGWFVCLVGPWTLSGWRKGSYAARTARWSGLRGAKVVIFASLSGIDASGVLCKIIHNL
jgi:hypothetical protein